MEYDELITKLEAVRIATADVIEELEKVADPIAHQHSAEMCRTADIMTTYINELTAKDDEVTKP